MKAKKLIVTVVILLFAIFLATNFVLAQDFGVQPVNDVINLESGDPRTIVGRIINIALSFLGLIVLSLMIYAGFLWMTSGGDEEKVRKAKDILQSAVIGLVITLSAWAIATFIISRLWGATTGTGNNNISTVNNNISSNSGLGAIGTCSVETVYPEDAQKDVPRNVSIIATFKEPVGLASVCIDSGGNSCECNNDSCALINPEVIRIFSEELGDACGDTCPEVNSNTSNVLVSISSDQKTMVLRPELYLGSSEKKTKYGVKITSDLLKSNGSSMFSSCSTNDFYWGFEVSTKVDLTPPQVVVGRLFPQPDSEMDVSDAGSVATVANAEIFVKDCPNVFKPAEVLSVTPEAEIDLYYHGLIDKFKVTIPADAENRAQLYNGNTNALLGISDFNDQGVVSFNSYFSLKAENRVAGSLWEVTITPEQKADTLTVGNTKYIFSMTPENNNIVVNQTSCFTGEQAINIQAKISGHPDVNVQLQDNRVLLSAKVAGVDGNEINLESTNNSALELTQFSGGTASTNNYIVNDKRDTAMNTVIKVGFNEAMNPVTLSGPAIEVSDYIRVINVSQTSLAGGSTCTLDSQCRSYNCDSSVCVGDYLNGRFMISDAYKTVEFISDNECGINGCGEKIYCLPPSSELAVEIRAADLNVCDNDQACAPFNPFKNCSLGSLGYRTCQDNNQRNYPAADIFTLNGITDAASNSLDGNKDTVADGPISFFNENTGDINNKDSYRFSFFVNNQKEISSPQITAVTPSGGQADILNLTNPVEITFNTLMMSSTLRSGSLLMASGLESENHKLINLMSSSVTPLGYWVNSNDVDSNPVDGISDITISEIKHSPFLEAISYSAQVGSGVKDVYQNCFKPSAGPGCQADWENPSCCFGIATSLLDETGNCE
ncbi:MAG TPA: pilin [Patescibacteria group bacterium]|nr:pilin [Patescibacteria group bacterium]